MSDRFAVRVGGVLSADIAVPQHQRVVRFYSHVLTTGDRPLWRGDLMNIDGIPVIGIGERTVEYAELPLQWMPHIQVVDVANSVERALALGGNELLHKRDEDGKSQWAVLLDVDGAAFGIVPFEPANDAASPEPNAGQDAGSNAGQDAGSNTGHIAVAGLDCSRCVGQP